MEEMYPYTSWPHLEPDLRLANIYESIDKFSNFFFMKSQLHSTILNYNEEGM